MLSTFTLENKNEWDKIVKTFKNFDIYYLSDYVKAFKIHGDGEPLLFYYKDEYIKAINVVMKRDIAADKNFRDKIQKNTYFDITTPYGYGGFLIEGKSNSTSLNELNKQYNNYCIKNNIISEFVRFHPLLNNSEELNGMYDVVLLGKTITVNLDSVEEIWDNLASKNRNVIRKAIKHDVETYWGRDETLMETFIPMYNQTMDKDNAANYYYFDKSFYKSILNDLKYNMMFFYAKYKGEIISMAMIVFANQTMHYHLSASNPKFNRLSPTNLLLTEVANWGSENGFTNFHLGGGLGSSEDDGLFKFKKKFNKKSNSSFAIGKKIFVNEKYQELLSLRKANNLNKIDSSFFPEYRQ